MLAVIPGPVAFPGIPATHPSSSCPSSSSNRASSGKKLRRAPRRRRQRRRRYEKFYYLYLKFIIARDQAPSSPSPAVSPSRRGFLASFHRRSNLSFRNFLLISSLLRNRERRIKRMSRRSPKCIGTQTECRPSFFALPPTNRPVAASSAPSQSGSRSPGVIPPFFVRSVPCRLRGPDAIETEGARRKAFFRKHGRVLRARCPRFRKKRVSRGMFNRRYIEMLPRRSSRLEREKERERGKVR